MARVQYEVTRVQYEMTRVKYEMTRVKYEMTRVQYEMTRVQCLLSLLLLLCESKPSPEVCVIWIQLRFASQVQSRRAEAVQNAGGASVAAGKQCIQQWR